MKRVQSEEIIFANGNPCARAKRVDTIPEEAWMKFLLKSLTATFGGSISPAGNG